MTKAPFDLCPRLNEFLGIEFSLTQWIKMDQNDDFLDENDAHNQKSEYVYQIENVSNTHYLCTEFLLIQMYMNYDYGFPDDDGDDDAHNSRSDYVNQTYNF